MPRFVSRLCSLLRLRRKRAGAAQSTNPDAAPEPLPVDSLFGTSRAHVNAPPQRDGVDEVDEVDEPIKSTVSPATATSSISSGPSDSAAARAATLESLPAELRRHIRSHVADSLGALRALVLASPVYYQQYLLDRKALLRTGLRAVLGNSLVDAYAVQTSAQMYDSASDYPHAHVELETIRLFIDNYVALRLSATPDAILEDCCTEDDLMGMVAFYFSLAHPLSVECAIRFLRHLDASLEVGNLSTTESSRLVRALCRWQVYCNLFGKGPDGGRREVHRLEYGRELDIFFCIFKPWEIEEMYCIYVLLKNTYSDLLDTVAWDLNRDNPIYQDFPNRFVPRLTWDLGDPYIRESAIEGLVMRGLEPFDDILTDETHDDLVLSMQYYLVHGGDTTKYALSWTNQFFRRERCPLEHDRMEAGRERLRFSGDMEDGPPLAWVIYWRGRYSNRYGGAVRPSLQTWGYVFWDARRLVKFKGTEEVLREREQHTLT